MILRPRQDRLLFEPVTLAVAMNRVRSRLIHHVCHPAPAILTELPPTTDSNPHSLAQFVGCLCGAQFSQNGCAGFKCGTFAMSMQFRLRPRCDAANSREIVEVTRVGYRTAAPSIAVDPTLPPPQKLDPSRRARKLGVRPSNLRNTPKSRN